jgi:hypothetical protein
MKVSVAQTETNGDGIFEFKDIELGVYSLKISARGFVSKSVANIRVTLGASEKLDIILEDEERGGGELQQYSSPGPQWNVWLEPFSTSAQFRRVTKLLQNKTYLLVVNLTGLDLEGQPGVYSSPISAEFSKALDADSRDMVPIGVLVVPAASFFDPPEQRFRTLPIDLTKIRRARNQKFTIAQDLFDYLKHNQDGPLDYGKQIFTLRTKDSIGSTYIGLSFWIDGKFPVDETMVPVCVVASESDACASPVGPRLGLRGMDSVRTAMQGGTFAYPDAALHFLETDSRSVIGVFRCNSCRDWGDGRFLTWELGESAQELENYLTGTLLKDFEDADNEEAFIEHGQDLFDQLFQGTKVGSGEPARDAFLDFVKGHWAQTDPTPSIFVRLLPQQGDPLFLIPFGLMVPPDSKDFLGFHFRVETPLEKQNYATPIDCISNWDLLVPKFNGKDNDLQEARHPFAPWITAFGGWHGHASVYDRLGAFRNWVKGNGDNKQTAILIMSHHDANRLFLESNDIPLESKAVSRQLQSPSVVILNACGTGKPGAWDFVRMFNSAGASAAVATSITVEAHLAGLFVAQLMKELQNHAAETSYSLGQAKFDAALAVSKMPQPSNGYKKYGPQALIYMLAGNGGLKLCTPVLATHRNVLQHQGEEKGHAETK